MGTSPEPRFNLVHEPWVRCLMVDGAVAELSLTGVFHHLRGIKRISGDVSTQDYSVLRILLAIVWRAASQLPDVDNLESCWWHDLFTDEKPLTDYVDEYLTQLSDRFWLIHPEAPFMQVADLHTSTDKVDGVARVIVDAESDYFSTRAGSARESLSFAEAARWLIHAQAFDYSGIKSGAIGDPRVKGGKGYPIGTGWAGATGGIVIHGDTLLETLLLNTPPSLVAGVAKNEDPDETQDLPVWEREPDGAAQRDSTSDASVSVPPTGPCDIVTWQSRRIRYAADNDHVTGVLIAIGDRIDIKNQLSDPMTGLRYSKNQSKGGLTVYMPNKHDPAKTLWRGVEPLLTRSGQVSGTSVNPASYRPAATIAALNSLHPSQLPLSKPVLIDLIGLEYGTQDAVVLNSLQDTLSIDLATLSSEGAQVAHAVRAMADKTLGASSSIASYAGMLRQAAAPGSEFSRQLHAEQRYLSQIESEFRQAIARMTLQSNLDAEQARWRDYAVRTALRLADELGAEAGPKAVVGWLDASDTLHSTARAQWWFKSALRKHFPYSPDGETGL